MQEQYTPPEIIDKEKKLVKELSGIQASDTITFFDGGWDSRVYGVLNGTYFFKFPRSDKIRQRYKYEVIALKQASTISSPIKTPRIKWEHTDNKYFGYTGVEGEILSEVISTLDVSEKQKLGNLLGVFLKELHNLDVPHARDITIDEEIEQLQNWYQQGIPIIQSSFSADEKSTLEQLVYDVWPGQLMELGTDPVFSHGDLHFPNIIYNQGMLGIIDFGDAGYYDRSKDFIDIDDNVMFDSIMKSYGDSNNLHEKIMLRRKTSSIITLVFYAGKQDVGNVKKTVNKIKAHLD